MRWEARRATVADTPEIARINVEGWRHAYRGILDDGYLDRIRPEDRMESIARRVASPAPCSTWVAESEGGRIGAASTVIKARDPADRHPELATGELAAICADPAALGTGAGFAVHEAGLAAVRRQGYAHAVLWVFEKNELGRRFYEAHGWCLDTGETAAKSLLIGGREVVEVRYSRLLPPGSAG